MKTAAGVTYTYDGDGRRVMKSNGKIYWYGSGGEILAETDAAGNTLNEYIFFGGQRIAMLPAGASPLYYVEDFLGTSRVITSNTGVVCYDADFDPFGGEHAYTNTCPQNYKFEGKERDTETGNDDFGARYYSNRYGRWLSADWSAVPVPVPYANLTNPQTLNLYAMVADDPESFADLAGHQITKRWIIAALGHRKFFALGDLNLAIRELLDKLNQRPFKKREGSRQSLFLEIDQPALRPLPAERFDLSVWSQATVNKANFSTDLRICEVGIAER